MTTDPTTPKTLAAKVLAQDVGGAGHAGLLLRGMLAADEKVGSGRCKPAYFPQHHGR